MGPPPTLCWGEVLERSLRDGSLDNSLRDTRDRTFRFEFCFSSEKFSVAVLNAPSISFPLGFLVWALDWTQWAFSFLFSIPLTELLVIHTFPWGAWNLVFASEVILSFVSFFPKFRRVLFQTCLLFISFCRDFLADGAQGVLSQHRHLFNVLFRFQGCCLLFLWYLFYYPPPISCVCVLMYVQVHIRDMCAYVWRPQMSFLRSCPACF